MLEAQQSGLPVVAGYSEGVATIVDDGVTGLLSRAGDADALARAARHLLKDSAQRKRMGRNASDKAFRIHSLAGAAQQLNQFITEVTNACR
jgi:glycosyltransferase involved in cell wall biosynthesis